MKLRKIAKEIAFKISRSNINNYTVLLNYIVELDKIYIYSCFTKLGLDRLSNSLSIEPRVQDCKLDFLSGVWSTTILEGIEEQEIIDYISKYRHYLDTDATLNTAYGSHIIPVTENPFHTYGLLVYQAILVKILTPYILVELEELNKNEIIKEKK